MEIKVSKNQTRTAIYVRISTAQQKTDRQVVELKEYAKSHAITIEYYQSKGVHLYFKKQNIWIRDKSDISTQIMVPVLAVMSQYEIELFVARGIDGKITAIKSRDINCGGFTAYGYKVTPVDHKLVIDEEEAQVVQRIYQYYDKGKKW